MAKITSYRFDESTNTLYYPNPQGEGFPEIALDLGAVSAANNKRAALHGWHARVNDTAAIGMADKEGNIISPTERARIKSERMNDLCRFYESGTEEWGRKSEGGGGTEPIAVLAFARNMELDAATARERMERLAKSKNRTWKQQLAITERLFPEEVKAIQLERNKTPVQIDEEEELRLLKGE